jgi:hypothetical protein
VAVVNEVMRLSFPSVSGNSSTDDPLIISLSGSSKLPEVGSRLKQKSYLEVGGRGGVFICRALYEGGSKRFRAVQLLKMKEKTLLFLIIVSLYFNIY